MERVSAQRPNLDASKLDRTEIIGMIAAAVLVISVFLEWYSLSTDPSVVQRGNDPANWACGVGNSSCSGWDAFAVVGVLLILAAQAPRHLSRLGSGGHALASLRGDLTAVFGRTAVALIAFNGIRAKH